MAEYSFYCDTCSPTDRDLLISMSGLNRHRSRMLEICQLQNSVFVPGKGVFHEGRFLVGTYWGGVVPDGLALPDNDGYEVVGEAYYIGVIHPCWGHSITDGTRLLWPLVVNGVKKFANVDAFVYSMTNPDMELPKNFIRLLELIGIPKEKLLRIKRQTKFNKLYVAEEAYWYDVNTPEKRFFSDTYKMLVEGICASAVSGVEKQEPYRKVYLSRSGWQKGWGKVDFGESEIERAFAYKMNCEIIRPESLKFDEMVRILQETKTLVCTEGSISHNALFLPDGANLIILRKAPFVSYYQLMVNEIKNLNVTYIDANSSRLFYSKNEPYYGPFFLWVNRDVARFLGVACKFPFKVGLEYCWSLVSHKIVATIIFVYLKVSRFWR